MVEQIKQACLRPDMHLPREEPVSILTPLQTAFRAGGVERLLEEVEIAIGDIAKLKRANETVSSFKSSILDMPSRSMNEGEVVATWTYIQKALALRKLKPRSGELASQATRWQRLLMQSEYDIESRAAVYGRKVDLQCRVGDWELNNSEFKASSTSKEQVEVQYRKNIRINQAMILFLSLVGVVFGLKFRDGVFMSDLAYQYMLRLPDSGAS
ncbi:hypothetical protein BG011_004719 [Mortierella polycephala]|uniref:Uncharacterized protein n=1 Tax=Mortierella polycephala TaxID=41804 RepID=A0A9P6U1Z2_9FUNG|nr:hypothetical protein BG011_004719 [Mortierella polycephala]